MISITCPNCGKINKSLSLSKLLVEKGDSAYPFVHYENCCAEKNVKYILSENNGIVTEMVNV